MSILSYINSFQPTPSEVVLSAINTEAFGQDSKENFVNLIKQVLVQTNIPRLAFGSVHPWSLTDEFLQYYRESLNKEKRFVNFFHVPIQSGSQTVLGIMKRDYKIKEILHRLQTLHAIQPNALIATDVIVGFLGETSELFEETYTFLEKSPISKFHVFRFSNRPHTAAYYMKMKGNDMGLFEPSPQEKRDRSEQLIALSTKKYYEFIETQVGKTNNALIIAPLKNGYKILLDNHIEGYLKDKHYLPGQIVPVTILAAKDGVVVCKES